ncbi:hypothetical protein ACLMJK_004672 [Lecanora helva]
MPPVILVVLPYQVATMMYTFITLLLTPGLSLALSIPTSHSSSQNPLLGNQGNSNCDCSNTNPSRTPTNPPTICNDVRLGPVELPQRAPLLSFVSDYDRFGNDTPGQFLAKWTDSSTGKWRWPEGDGFSLDITGKPIKGSMILKVGTEVDRFGSENGTFVSAADAPFDQRSLPPSSRNLAYDDHNASYPYGYHIYTVEKEFVVEAGPIAPWFGQPGLGAQFKVAATGQVWQLVEWKFLKRVPKKNVKPRLGEGGGCGS